MKKPFYKVLYVQVLFAIACGVLLGYFEPKLGVDLKPLGDGFIKLVKMIIAPVIFCTVVHGIAGMQDMKKVGRVGGKALLYFELVSTLALVIGLLVANIAKPGAGFNADLPPSTPRPSMVSRPRPTPSRRWTSSSTSSPTPSSTPSPRATSCRCC